jgi:sulfotransferase family protein
VLSRDEVARDVLAYATGMEQARELHGGLVVRYEDLTHDPEPVTRRLCEFIGVEWRPAMIDYGAAPHAGLRRGLGDWSDKMRSGAIQPAAPTPPPEQIPEVLRPIARAWGYLPAG